jgi:membrane protein
VLSLRELGHLSKGAIRGWIDDAAPSMGASLAFYTLFSLTPLLLVIIALAGFFLGRNEAQNLLIAQIAQFSGEKAAYGIEALLDAAGSRDGGPFAIIAGMVTLLLGATTVFAELRVDLNRIWRYKPTRGGGAMRFVRTRLLSFAVVALAGLLLLASMVASTLLATIGRRWFPDAAFLLHAGEFGISFLVLAGLFASIYKLLPGCRIEWRDVWVGAAVTSVLFWIGKILIAFYMAKAAVGESFGAAGAIVVVIAWVYYSAQVFFLGAEFTRQYALRHGSRQHEPLDRRRKAHGRGDEKALVERAQRLVRGDDPVLERPRKAA